MTRLNTRQVEALACELEYQHGGVASPTVDGRIYLYLSVDDTKGGEVASDIMACGHLPEGWVAVAHDRTRVEVRRALPGEQLTF